MKRSIVTSVFFSIVRKIFLLMLCFFLPVAAAAQDKGGSGKDPAALFEEANIAHTQGKYQQAAELYLRIVRSNGVSAPLLYNLANSYAAAGQIGSAVLNYERALRLAPGDADIQANLDQVRKDAGLYRQDRSLYRHLADLLAADQWLMIAGFAFLLLAVSALTANVAAGEGMNGIFRLLTVGSLLVLLLTLLPALLRYQEWNVGVVLQQDARLLISPFADAASAGGIKAGRLIRPVGTHGDYVLIEDETGKNGWLVRDGFQQVAGL